jgi:formylglycine-generating enzyme required for sulfatase activity
MQLNESRKSAAERRRVTSGSTADMVRLDGGRFFMGSESAEAFASDGEGPVREVLLDPFYISKYTVTNEQFAEFISRTGYISDAQRWGWSFVFRNHVPEAQRGPALPATPWWVRVEGADWLHPEGPHSEGTAPSPGPAAHSTGPAAHSTLHHPAKPHHPVVQVSWNDAQAYCQWAGVRLPTEAEWEFAARGGLEQKTYPWGDEPMPGGRHACNIWQGTFPDIDLAEDGFSAPAPVDSFAANGYGLFNAVGNVWEWCSDNFDAQWHQTATRVNPVGPPSGAARVMKGGSYLCHASFCFRYRNAARTANTPDSATGNIGFRVVRDV